MFELLFEAEQHFVFIDMSEDDFLGNEEQTSFVCIFFVNLFCF